jgi:hypothetical protein
VLGSTADALRGGCPNRHLAEAVIGTEFEDPALGQAEPDLPLAVA